MAPNVTIRSSAATRKTARPDASKQPAALLKTRNWLAACAIAAVATILLWAAWPADASGSMTAEDFRQMYEGCSSEDSACPTPFFP